MLPVGEKTPGFRPSAVGERERVIGVWLSQEIAEAVVATLNAARFDIAIVDVSLLTAFAGCEAVTTPFILDPNDVAPGLLAAVQQVISERRFAEAAADMARSIAGHGGVEEALGIIERCARAHEPQRTGEAAAG